MAKNKAKKVSAKAARNKEALKKAKDAIQAEEKKVIEQTVQQPEEKPVEEPKKAVEAPKKETKVSSFPVGKTAHETFQLVKKHPHASMLSMKIEKGPKDSEQIRVEFKNVETNETVTTVFPVSNIVPEDNIDLDKLKKAAGWIKEPKKEEKKKETKKPIEKVKEEPVKVVIPENVEEDKPTSKVIKPIATSLKKSGDRIDANRSIDLMNAILKRREEIRDINPAMYQAAGKQADLMMWRNIQIWNDQLADDAKEAGIAVNQEIMDYLKNTASLFLGIKTLPCKEQNGQLMLDFQETMQQVPAETKAAIEQDAAAVVKQPKEVTIPTPEECSTEEDKLNAIRTIANVRCKGTGTMGKNIENVINFGRKAFKLDDNAEPAQVLAVIMSKFQTAGMNTTLFEGLSNAIFGNLTGNMSSIAAHAWLKNQLTVYNDSQVANITRVFLAKKAADIAVRENKDATSLLTTYGALLSGMNDDLINRIIKSANNGGKDDDKLIYTVLKDSEFSNKHIASTKVVNNVKTAYGAEMSDKLLKQQMQKIITLYTGKKLSPLATYVEKSAYAVKK